MKDLLELMKTSVERVEALSPAAYLSVHLRNFVTHFLVGDSNDIGDCKFLPVAE